VKSHRRAKLAAAAAIGLGCLVAIATWLVAQPSDNRVEDYVRFIRTGDERSAFLAICKGNITNFAEFSQALLNFQNAEKFRVGRGTDSRVPISFRLDGETFNFNMPVVERDGERVACPPSPTEPFGIPADS
jgi:hypothetical protein